LNKKMKYNVLVILSSLLLFADLQAQDGPVLTFTIPTQNNLLLNRFLINPTFSAVRESDSYLTLYHRNQWIQFNDSPELYMLSYSGKHGERAGVGIGIYQQNIGIITSFGGIGNYAYQIPIQEKMSLTVGINLAYYSSGVNRNRAVSNEPDPALMELRNNSILTLKPGINFSWGSFDIGVYAENLVDYDFKSSEMVEEYSEKTYTSHVVYNHQMLNQEGLFEEGYFRLMARGKFNQTDDFQYGGSLMVNFPKLGWVQAGVDDFFGVGVGAGAHLTRKLSLGYTYEQVTKEGLINFGPTHEITISYRFGGKENAGTNSKKRAAPKKKTASVTSKPKIKRTIIIEEEIEEDELVEESYEDLAEEPEVIEPALKTKKENTKKTSAKTIEKETKINAETNIEKALEIEKLKMTLDENNLKLLEIIIKQDSIENMKKADFDQRIENMMTYIKRLETTIAEKDCNCEPKTTTIIEEEKVTNTTKTTSKNSNQRKEENKSADLNNKLNTMKSATQKEAVKIPTTKKTAQEITIENKLATLTNSKNENTNTNSKFSLSDEEIKAYYSQLTNKKRATAKKGNFLQVDNQEPGFYIIANVFSDPSFADEFLKKLKKQGVEASYFINPKNNFRYVYLKKHSDWSEALISYYTNVDNTYFDEIWIMNINIK
jgi:type IX secretion system PorP/SprF family membrane protein